MAERTDNPLLDLVEIDDHHVSPDTVIHHVSPDTVIAEWTGQPRCLGAALAYAAKGWPVFPAPRGEKKSYKSEKFSGAKWGKTTDGDEIRRDFARWPNANVGLPTGTEFFVVEVDTIAGGHEFDGTASLAALEEKHGKLPTTLTAESPSGGPHYYFNKPEDVEIRNSTSKIAPGIDVRGSGGMVLAPPSVKLGVGSYSWTCNAPIAEAPDWLVELATKNDSPERAIGERSLEELTGDPSVVRTAATLITNPDLDFDEWNRRGMAIFAATSGSDEGLTLFLIFSAKSNKYDLTTTMARWEGYKRCPPTKIGMGTIIYLADEADPGWRARYDSMIEQKLADAADDDQMLADLEGHKPKTADDGDSAEVVGSLASASEQRADDDKQRAKDSKDKARKLPSGVTLDDFYSYMPKHEYIFTPTGELWPASSVNSRLPPIRLLKTDGTPQLDEDGKEKTVRPSTWFDSHRAVEQMTWAPGLGMTIDGKLVNDGGWIERPGTRTFNLYRPPVVKEGNPAEAAPWVELMKKLWPGDHGHIVAFCAHRIQKPEEKINHGLLLGGAPGIGKDTLLEPLKLGVGAWNFKEVSPQDIVDKYNDYMKSVVLRISEAHDLGDVNRYSFYDRMKTPLAAPPDVVRVNSKYVPQHYVVNITSVIYTTNHRFDAIYLPPTDRRHYVAWSEVTPADFADGFWSSIWKWYLAGGLEHVVAYLKEYKLDGFDPKAPPPKTEAFWQIVGSGAAPENAEMADVLDQIGNPVATTLAIVVDVAVMNPGNLGDWLKERKNRRVIPHKFEACGYAPILNSSAKDGLWVIGGKRQTIYARQDVAPQDRLVAALELVRRGGSRT